MPVPHVSTNFPDVLDPRFQRIAHETYNELPDMLGRLYNFETPTGGPMNEMKFSQVGTLSDWTEFTGKVQYDALNEGYDSTITPVEFTKGVQIERKLFDDALYGIMDQRPRGLARSYFRTRQGDGADMLNNAFSVWTTFYVNTENVALCSNSHTTRSGASTANGFDNLDTAALSATAVATARINMRDFRDDRANRISVAPNELWHPPNLYEEAYEIINASGKVDTDLNNPNVHQGAYTSVDWEYLTDTNNWFLSDSGMRSDMVHWWDRIPVEFAFVEDFDTLVGKFRGYARYGLGHSDWRWVYGANVS